MRLTRRGERAAAVAGLTVFLALMGLVGGIEAGTLTW